MEAIPLRSLRTHDTVLAVSGTLPGSVVSGSGTVVVLTEFDLETFPGSEIYDPVLHDTGITGLSIPSLSTTGMETYPEYLHDLDEHQWTTNVSSAGVAFYRQGGHPRRYRYSSSERGDRGKRSLRQP